MNSRRSALALPMSFTVVVLLMTFTLLVAACVAITSVAPQSASTTAASEAAEETKAISIVGFAFDPQEVTVTVGTTVTWTNLDETDHTTTSLDDEWPSQELGPGDSYSHTFTTPGFYEYQCLIHGSMFGSITVVEATAEPTTEPTEEPTQEPEEVSIANFAFDPAEVTVPAGTTVNWTNLDSTRHTTTSLDGEWNSGNLAPNGTFSHTFTTPGFYEYQCLIHGSMFGSIEVTE